LRGASPTIAGRIAFSGRRAVNHYERLKVTPDAPAEVIEAAYQAWCKVLEPQAWAEDGPAARAAAESLVQMKDAHHVLCSAPLRQEYDAALITQAIHLGELDEPTPSRLPVDVDDDEPLLRSVLGRGAPGLSSATGDTASAGHSARLPAGAQDRSEGIWGPQPERAPWLGFLSEPWAWLGMGVLLALGAWWVAHGVDVSNQAERVLSQYSVQPEDLSLAPETLVRPFGQSSFRATVDALDESEVEGIEALHRSRMRTFGQAHPLDGAPLGLRVAADLPQPPQPVEVAATPAPSVPEPLGGIIPAVAPAVPLP